MLILKRSEAFERAVKAFGPWNTWRRGHHLAYGLARGVAYAVMERTANDNPLACWPSIQDGLVRLGVLPDLKAGTYEERLVQQREVESLIFWVHKVPRVRSAKADVTEAAQ